MIIYSLYRAHVTSFWDSAIGNWLATLLGVIAGVPIALAFERKRIAKEEVDKAKEKKDQAKKVLFLIKEELQFNQEKLEERKLNPKLIHFITYKNALWKVLADSGQIQWISDPTLLNKISYAYFYIGIVTSIEKKLYDVIRSNEITYGNHKPASAYLFEDARRFDTDLDERIFQAMNEIERFLVEN